MKKYEHMEIAFHAELKTRAKFVLQCLAMHANSEGKCFPGIKTIASECGYSINTVKRALKDLEEAEFIKKEARFDVVRKNGAQTSNLYILLEVEVPEKKVCDVPKYAVVVVKNDIKVTEVDEIVRPVATKEYDEITVDDMNIEVTTKKVIGNKEERNEILCGMGDAVDKIVHNSDKNVDNIALMEPVFLCYVGWTPPGIRSTPP